MTKIRPSQDILIRLSQGIAELASSDKWQDYLKLQTHFHNYSYANVLLIMQQRPDATRVAGYGTWKSLGRNVMKGEKAIAILAPILYKRERAQSENSQKENEYDLYGFKVANVFDISQTQGKDLLNPYQKLAGGDYSALYKRLTAIASSLGFDVFQEEMPPEINGNCSHSNNRININKNNSSKQQIKTFIHELAHAVMHKDFTDRALGELEAESVAYIACDYLGIDSSNYSFGYILSWSNDSKNAETLIKKSCTRIQKTSSLLINMLSEKPAAAVA